MRDFMGFITFGPGARFALRFSFLIWCRTSTWTPLPSHTPDPKPDIPPHTPPLKANKRNNPAAQRCTSVIRQAASSYNNIALWRSPERTGKGCLCPSTERGGAGHRGCLYSPNNGPRAVEGGRLRISGRTFKEAVVHLQVSPLGLTRCEHMTEGGCRRFYSLGWIRTVEGTILSYEQVKKGSCPWKRQSAKRSENSCLLVFNPRKLKFQNNTSNSSEKRSPHKRRTWLHNLFLNVDQLFKFMNNTGKPLLRLSYLRSHSVASNSILILSAKIIESPLDNFKYIIKCVVYVDTVTHIEKMNFDH